MHQWIDDVAALDDWLTARADRHIVGLDTEFMRTNTFRAKLAVVQINLGGDIALLDSPQLGAHGTLGAHLRDTKTISVIHSASEDLEALADVVPDGPANLFDTQIAAAMAGLGFGLSYQKICALLLDIDIPKAETRSDWLARPLSDAQLEYAAQDVAHLLEIHARLDARLGELGRREWLAEDCARLVDRVCRGVPDDQPQRQFRTAADWPLEQRARLRRELLWREATARQLDRPRPWILDDAHLLDFASQPPRNTDELFERSKGLRALRGPQRAELFELLHREMQPEESNIAPIPRPFSNTERRHLQALRDKVAAVAQRENIPEGLLCSRRYLEQWLTDKTWPVGLEGWRKPLLFDALTS